MTDHRRHWLQWLSTASAALMVLLLLLLARASTMSDTFDIRTPGGAWQFQSHRGGLFVTRFDNPKALAIANGRIAWASAPPAAAHVWPEWNIETWDEQMLLGFALTGGDGFTAARLPLWYLIAMSAVLPIWWLRHPLRRLRRKFGTCAQCGYDLRASLDRCPECGMSFRSNQIDPAPRAETLTPGHTPRRPTDDNARYA